MRFKLIGALRLRTFRRGADLLPIVLLSAAVAAIIPAALGADDRTGVQNQPPAEIGEQTENDQAKQNTKPEPSTPPATSTLCEALVAAATTNDLPIDFFTRLIWQESRFRPDAVSRKGAQGIAQFMPETARLNGLENPFDPIEAVAKSGQLLHDLRREFGNLGLAAAAYNAGPRRVHDWLGGQRPLPQETRTYVLLVTGRSVEEWSVDQSGPVTASSLDIVPCNPPATSSVQPKPDLSVPGPQTTKPWGVEVVGGPTPAKALARYHEWKTKYVTIVADREPHVVIRGIIGEMGAARVRVGEDNRAQAEKLCAALKAAGTYCDVLRN